jgi:hypothetical protein
MLHPLARIKPERRGYYFYPLLIGTVLIMAIMNYVGLPLNTVAAPSGIVSFEIAATPERAQQIPTPVRVQHSSRGWIFSFRGCIQAPWPWDAAWLGMCCVPASCPWLGWEMRWPGDSGRRRALITLRTLRWSFCFLERRLPPGLKLQRYVQGSSLFLSS